MSLNSSYKIDFLSISAAGSLFRKKEVSPVELLESHLNRIHNSQSSVNAFITVTSELARKQAQIAEDAILKGDPRPLLGIPIAYKDIYMTAGIPTTGGSALHADYVPPITATTILKLEDAGVVSLGKLSTNEFAAMLSTFDHKFPPARNPWNLDHIPGGSSSGSGAALAAGLAIGTLGTDTGGSIRNPGSFSGIAALKPTYGRCSRYGVYPLSWSLDHTGPMARNCEDIALMLNAMSGYDDKDPASANVPTEDFTVKLQTKIAGLKLGVLRSWYEPEMHSSELQIIADAIALLKELGAEVVYMDLPNAELAEVSRPIITNAEAFAYHANDLNESPELYASSLRNRFSSGALLFAHEYIDALRARTIFNAGINALFKDVDLLISPTCSRAATPFSTVYDRPLLGPGASFTRPFNMNGSPALNVLCGFTEENLPLGLQIIGRHFDESTVLQVGNAYEKAAGWNTRHPS